MFLKHLVILVCNTLLLLAYPSASHKTHNKSHTTQTSAMLLLQQCANGIQDSCATLLQYGIPNVNECEPVVCHIVGATLSANENDIEAIAYLRKSCQSSERLGCTLLGLLYQTNGDAREAEYAYNIACKHGDVIGCYNMGLLQANGISSNKRESLQSFRRACFMQYAKACFNLAVMYANYKKDSMYALYFFHIACDYGITKACKHAQLLKDSGITLPPLQKKRGLYIKPTFE